MLASTFGKPLGERGVQAKMVRPWRSWVRDGLGIAALLLALLNVAGAQRNRALQADVTERQAALQRGQTFANVNNSMIQMLAKAAVERNDPAIRDLLARNGITFQVTPGAVPPAPAPAPVP